MHNEMDTLETKGARQYKWEYFMGVFNIGMNLYNSNIDPNL